jgi:hypothetical protein
MQLPIVRNLIQNHNLAELQAAEAALVEEQAPAIEVGGVDEGEQLTHVLLAIWAHEQMAAGVDDRTVLRQVAQRVRDSIS